MSANKQHPDGPGEDSTESQSKWRPGRLRVSDVIKGLIAGGGTGTAGMLLVMVLNNQTLIVQQGNELQNLNVRIDSCEAMRTSMQTIGRYHHDIIAGNAKIEARVDKIESDMRADVRQMRRLIDGRMQIMETRIDRYANANH